MILFLKIFKEILWGLYLKENLSMNTQLSLKNDIHNIAWRNGGSNETNA